MAKQEDSPESLTAVKKRGKKAKGAVMTRKEFIKAAKPQKITLDGVEVDVKPKQFSTGTVGWFTNEKRDFKLKNGKTVRCQVQLQLFVCGSKTWQEE